jgi:hypothetical protein
MISAEVFLKHVRSCPYHDDGDIPRPGRETLFVQGYFDEKLGDRSFSSRRMG